MIIPDEIQNDFYEGKRSDKIHFCINDAVQIIAGDHLGKCCAVISIEQLEPEVVYLVENGEDGSSIMIPQKMLFLIEG